MIRKIIVNEDSNGNWVAPFLIDYTEEEAKRINRLWKWSGHEYIVDPLGCDQCLALEYDELPTYFKWLFNIKEERITYADYKSGKYKNL